MDVAEYVYKVEMKMNETIDAFILTYLHGSEIVQQAELSKDELKRALWLLAENNAGRLARVGTPLTDVEKKIFLSAMEKERNECENIDRVINAHGGTTPSRLAGVCKDVEDKVKFCLWGNGVEKDER